MYNRSTLLPFSKVIQIFEKHSHENLRNNGDLSMGCAEARALGGAQNSSQGCRKCLSITKPKICTALSPPRITSQLEKQASF